MLQYVDSFFCTYNQAKENYVIRLQQEEPKEGDSSETIAIQTNEVASIIMDKRCALQLARSIIELISSDSEVIPAESEEQQVVVSNNEMKNE